MTPVTRAFFGAMALTFFGLPLHAQEVALAGEPATDSTAAEASSVISVVRPLEIQNLRPNDRRGLNMFESRKSDLVPYKGFRVNLGGAFTQQFQGLDHSNTAQERLVNNVNVNQLVNIGNGFNNAVANMYIDAQVARGIRVAMTSYLSSRHHNETWVKDGYLQVDASPINHELLNRIMDVTTLKVGHFEVNYGDQHFRRTDNGQSLFNPLVGNFIMDAFTTEIGTEAYIRPIPDLFVMGGIFAGESKGMVQKADQRAPAFLGKIGFDKQITQDLRFRVSGSAFSQAQATSQTLYSGDRAGSRYYSVMENNTDEKSAFTSGAINPGFNSIHAYVINPFIKFHGLELFGNIETSNGRARNEAVTRTFKQNVGEVTYRFLNDALYLSGRYNNVTGRLATYTEDVEINRTQFGGGWYINPMILMKAEYVNQNYDGFAATDIRNGGNFKGFMVEAALAF
ncbi:MAG TPA: hypothetical protein VFT96_07565 [Gemmatimonadaceae bacterium]|nr:hypothetical protein [Gemmatimonadaceae bacterium]